LTNITHQLLAHVINMSCFGDSCQYCNNCQAIPALNVLAALQDCVNTRGALQELCLQTAVKVLYL
jgi:hypothetical protein